MGGNTTFIWRYQHTTNETSFGNKGPLADRLPTLTIAAKNLATEMTNYNVEQKDFTNLKVR